MEPFLLILLVLRCNSMAQRYELFTNWQKNLPLPYEAGAVAGSDFKSLPATAPASKGQ
ncbi:hypothetical protein AB4865_01130 [Capnocytophaga sp. ARDL2]|uniref:hypothetical protein n=1 Tax=Capnocytophaga sp. ARDL2 TaxID=3238809 RepID=UPI003557F88C